MAINVRIPTPLRKVTKDKDVVQVSGATITEIVENLETALERFRRVANALNRS